MFWIPILGAFALGSGAVLERFVLRKKSMNQRVYQANLFLAVVLIMLPFLYFFWKFDVGALEWKNILIFLLVVLFSVFANILAVYAMKWEKIENLEPAKVMEPMFVVLLAIVFSFFFGTEMFGRNFKVIIPAIIAVGALIFSHIRRHHFEMNKYFLAAIGGSFFYALELILSRLILDFYSPLSFYFFRCLAIFFIMIIIFRPKFGKLKNKVKLQVLLIAFTWVVYRVAVYYGYMHLGVVSTTLVVMLGPVFVYIFAHKFLKEKIQWRNIVASAVIIACVVYALFA